MPRFFAVTLFVSSALLFLVQPMFAKMVLPLLGGSPERQTVPAVKDALFVLIYAILLIAAAGARAQA